MCRMNIIFSSEESLESVDTFPYSYHVFLTSQKFLGGVQSRRVPQKMAFFMIFGKYWDANKPTSGTIKTQKLPYADVWKCKMCLRRRMGLPFALVDRYDPKQVCKSIGWCMKAYRKFFHGTQVQTWRSPKHNFWSYFRFIRDFPLKWSSKHKNCHMLTFGSVKCV